MVPDQGSSLHTSKLLPTSLSKADLQRLKTGSGLRVFSGAARPYPAEAEQTP